MVTVHGLQGLQGQVGVDRSRTETDQQREVTHLAGFAGLHHHTGAHAQALPDQVVVDGSGRQQTGDGDPMLVHAAVAQDEDARAVGDGAGEPLGDRRSRAR